MGGAGDVMEMERCVECSKQTCNQYLTMFNDVDFQESVLRWDGNRNNLSKHS